jgi:tetratricopeptide (TPR) repeat protein
VTADCIVHSSPRATNFDSSHEIGIETAMPGRARIGLPRYDAAVQAYERMYRLDPTDADAHFNVARLSEILGDKQGLVRHLSAYRRLIG